MGVAEREDDGKREEKGRGHGREPCGRFIPEVVGVVREMLEYRGMPSDEFAGESFRNH